MIVEADAVLRVESSDGKRVFELLKRSEGYFRYHEWSEFSDISPAGPYTYWASTSESGIFEDQASALADALSQLPWLEAEISG